MYKYNIILSNSDQNMDKELHLLNTMLGKQVDGIVFMSGNVTEEHVEEFKRSPVPIVLAASVEEKGKRRRLRSIMNRRFMMRQPC